MTLIQSLSFSCVYPCYASFLSRETALIDFPHSRQTRLARGGISPQNGHILWERTSWVRGLVMPATFQGIPAQTATAEAVADDTVPSIHLCRALG